MKILKRLFVGSIILVLLTTPLLVSAGINEKTETTNMSVLPQNSLGWFDIVHQAFLPSRKMISKCVHNDPPDNPTYQYWFPEDEEGYVDMNFTVNFTHVLNDVGTYFSEVTWPNSFRFTCAKLWIRANNVDSPVLWTQTLCINFIPGNYTITLKDGEPLKTNGQTIQGEFWWSIYAGPQPNAWINENIMWYFSPWTGRTSGSEDIYIKPTR